MEVKIRFTNGTDSKIEDAYDISAKPDDFFVRVFHPEGTIMINHNMIGIMEVIDEEDDGHGIKIIDNDGKKGFLTKKRFYKEGDKNE